MSLIKLLQGHTNPATNLQTFTLHPWSLICPFQTATFFPRFVPFIIKNFDQTATLRGQQADIPPYLCLFVFFASQSIIFKDNDIFKKNHFNQEPYFKAISTTYVYGIKMDLKCHISRIHILFLLKALTYPVSFVFLCVCCIIVACISILYSLLVSI